MIVRALLPYSLANVVTVASVYASAVFTYLFVSRLGRGSAPSCSASGTPG